MKDVRSWGAGSLAVRAQLDPRLVLVADGALETIDYSLICGHRGEADQTAALASGTSRIAWPRGKHNRVPSHAFDFRPYPFDAALKDWSDIARFARVWGHIEAVSVRLSIRLRWGGDFDGDQRSNDDGWDWGHVELVG